MIGVILIRLCVETDITYIVCGAFTRHGHHIRMIRKLSVYQPLISYYFYEELVPGVPRRVSNLSAFK